MPSVGTTRAAGGAFFLLFLLALSLPPKWATLHLAGLGLVASIGFARREDWRTPAMRMYLLCTALWLVPVLVSAGLQHAFGVPTAPDGYTFPVLILRLLGIGGGLIVLLQRGWLTLRSASIALLCSLAIHAGAGLVDLVTEPSASLTAWRELRINGLVFNPNPFGTFMALATVFSAGLLRDRLRQPALWALLAAALIGVWASGSRGAILAAVAGFLVLFPPRDLTRLVLYVCGTALAASLYLLVGQSAAVMNSDSERMVALAFTLEKTPMSPWIGWGMGAYEIFPDRVGPQSPHNILLDLAFSSGLPALLAWVLSTALLISRLRRCGHPATRLALAMLAAVIMAGMTEYSILASTHFRGIWVIVSALACCLFNECGTGPRIAARTHPDVDMITCSDSDVRRPNTAVCLRGARSK